ncbi:MAG: ABC transporter permease subunit [Candidatus Wallbacteria bacterium]|nr:ABC transporter permease subunit [Candidatus Wallbacteria bacterium]
MRETLQRLVWVGLLVAALTPAVAAGPAAGRIVIGAKNFTEQIILGEMLAILAEEGAGLEVVKKFPLGGSHICFEAIKKGEIDVYPEYTGTALAAILKLPIVPDRAAVYKSVKEAFEGQYGLTVLKPLDFNNTYTLTLTAARAKALSVKSITDLVPHAREMLLGCTHEFVERPDGLPGLQKTYGIEFREVKALDPGLTYKALAEGKIDVCDGYMTDGRIKAYNLQVLDDDRRFFPPYQALPVVRTEIVRKHPKFREAVERLGGLVTDEEMREMNYAVDDGGKTAEEVARAYLASKGLARHPIAGAKVSSHSGFLAYMWDRRAYLAGLTAVHLQITGIAVLLASLVGLPFGILLSRKPQLAPASLMIINVVQTIPSLALLGFMVPLLGIGAVPAIFALFLYALLPIVRNTFTGIRGVDAALLEAARGLGMTDRQVLFMVELPLALPVIMAGVRTSTVINIGTATLAALIGAGGLGEPIFRGIAMVDPNVILSGAVPAALLAVAADLLLARLELALAPRRRSKR